MLFLWCFLTGISICCLLKARLQMKEQLKMEELLSQESREPLMVEQQAFTNTAPYSKPSHAIRMGCEDADAVDDSSFSTKTAKMKASVIQIGTVQDVSLFGVDDAQSTVSSMKTDRSRRKLKQNEQLINSINASLIGVDDAQSTALTIKTDRSRRKLNQNEQLMNTLFTTETPTKSSSSGKQKRRNSNEYTKSSSAEKQKRRNRNESSSSAKQKRRGSGDAKTTDESVSRKERTDGPYAVDLLFGATVSEEAKSSAQGLSKSIVSERQKSTSHRRHESTRKSHQIRKSHKHKSDQSKSVRSDKVTAADTASFLFA